MNIREALATFRFGKKKAEHEHLYTEWGDRLDPEQVLQEYPRPQMVRSSYQNLNGYWEYAIRGVRETAPLAYDGLILVPFSPETILSGVRRQLQPDETLWYRRTFEVPAIPKGRHLLLVFGAVDQSAEILINDRFAGRHTGGYLSFSVDITQFLQTGTNTLTVRVRDVSDTKWMVRGKQKLASGGMFYTAQSGIWQTVFMEWVPDIYIRSLKITPLFDEQSVEITVFTTADVPVRISFSGDGPLPDAAEGLSGSPLLIRMPSLHAWSPEDPFLYTFTAAAGEDRVSSYFAMRKFSVMSDESGLPRLALNNRPYFEDGVLDQGYWSDGLYTAPSDEAMVSDIASMKALGFNMIRKHLKTEPMRWYYHCDHLGMIVWQDIPNGGGRSYGTFLLYLMSTIPFVPGRFRDSRYFLFARSSEKGRRAWIRDCRAIMEQLYNCPCIGLWTAFNEGWGQFDALKICRQMKIWDSTRLVDHASGWYDQGGGDIVSLHSYLGKPAVRPDKRPFCLSEYGGCSLHVDGHSFSDQDFTYARYEDLSSLQKAFSELRLKIHALEKDGLAAAVYTQLSDVEEEVNGILTFDRKVSKITSG